jgi:HK97 family phage major capsid protein
MSDRIYFAGKVSAEGRRIRGSVQLAGTRTFRNGEWVEIDPAALSKADASDVVARWNHDDDKILARTTNGTLRVKFTDDGIEYETDDLPNTTYANDTLELLRGGYVPGSSFEIEGLKFKRFKDEDGASVLRYTEIERVNDVSPTPHPAFETSMAAAFHKETDVAEESTTQEAPPAAPEAPTVSFKAEPKNESAAFEAAARPLTNEQIEAVMDNIMGSSGGNLEGEMLSRYEAFAKVYAERVAVSSEEKDRAKRMKALHDIRLGRISKPDTEAGLYESDDYKQAFNSYLRTGQESHVQQFAQSIAGTGAEGGYTVPDGFLNKLVERKKAFGGIASISTEITTPTGESLRFPKNDDTANSAAIAAEGVAGAAGADVVFGNITLGAFTYNANGTSNVPLKVSWELLQDSAFDIESWIAGALGTRIGRKQAADLAVGAGTTLPFGLLSKTPDTMTATTTYAASIEHEFQVDPQYRSDGNCRWVMSDATLFKFRAALDDEGRPLWLPAAEAGMTTRPGGVLNGYPVTIDNGAGALVAFGDIRAGYIVRHVKGVQVMVDPYTASGTRQTTYHAWARMDANIQDAFAYSVSDYTNVNADTASG